jgi:SAM-dependent methyltransferase
MAMTNKDHWYDGPFYDRLIAPNQDRLFKQIKSLIEPNCTVIDVGCGTGRFSFSVADKCMSVVGLDLSKRNIDTARANLQKRPNDKISFLHKNLSDLITDSKQKFDYAVLTYVIHEVDPLERITLLAEIALIADRIIIGDYLVPKPISLWSVLNEIVEFVAGPEHFRNYKNYVHNGGIQDLAERADLKIISEVKNQPATSHLAVLMK